MLRGRFAARRPLAPWFVLCVAALAALTLVPPAGARTLHSVLQDDALSLFSPSWLPQYMSRLRWLGVDELRISAEWKLEAPDANSPTPPRGFRFSDPSAYDSPGTTLLDRAVRAATGAGLGVIIDPAFSAPRWATTDHGGGGSSDQWYRTNIAIPRLVAWETMLARRYSGRFTPAGARTPLPRVGTFTLWNEPNGPDFLQPQWRGAVPASADWSRELDELAYPAIKRVSPNATVLIGNTSDVGADTPGGRGVSPMAFIRRLACVDAQLRPVHDGSCAHFQTVPADGYAHHPYERNAPPWTPSSGTGQAGWAQMGDLPKLQALLDELVAMHRLAPGAASLWLTEQGYESNAELGNRPWSEARQAQMNAASDYLAARDPQLASIAQFLLRDTLTYETLTLRARTGRSGAQLPGTWTTGLMREDMTPKPSLSMFRSPIVVRVLARGAGGSELLEVWGRARPVRTPTEVRIQIASQDGFRASGATRTDQNGIFDTELALPTAGQAPSVRFQWLAANGTWQTSPATQPLPIPGAS
jgi:hypothetical protein